MRSNLRYSRRKINPYGGLNFIHPFFKSKGIERLVNESMGERVKQAKYSISDIIIAHTMSTMAGAERLEHQQAFIKCFSNIKDVKMPSSDTTARIFKRLATKNIEYEGKKTHHLHCFNDNPKLNDLLIKTGLQLGLIKRNARVNILDYDNSIIQTLKYDATKTYKPKDDEHNICGYQPGFGTLNNIPVYVEGRKGHSTASTSIGETFIRMMKLLENNGIKVTLFRADAAAFNKTIIKYCERRNIDFIIRSTNTAHKRHYATWDVKNWEKHVDRDGNSFELGSGEQVVQHLGRMGSHVSHRLLVKRKTDFKGCHMFSFLITNDRTSSNKKILDLYAGRSSQEKQFAELKNDWNLKRPPHSFIAENTVFWIVSLIGYTFYKFILKKVSGMYGQVKPTHWLRKFRERFIQITVEICEDGGLAFFEDGVRLYGIFMRLMDEW